MSLCLAHIARYDEAAKRAREALDIARAYRYVAYVAWCVEHLATIAALTSDDAHEPQTSLYACTARILGYADARLWKIGSARLPFVQPYYRRILDRLREKMGGAAVASLMAEGATMTEDEAIEAAISM